MDATGAKYSGEWLNDLQHGQGEESWNNQKTRYIGIFYKGKKSGKGRFEWEDGSFYEGDFVDGYFQGYGKVFFSWLTNLQASTTSLILISGMRESSEETIWKAEASKHGTMAEDTKVTSKTAKRMEKVHSNGQMVTNTLEVGGMTSSTAMEYM